ncbi:SOS response-associated peptidase family protein [Rhodanobacter sp. AS-Z3]|uniref:SOS response-associated peptidase family protein n=1 Tax=Rhodanobacter sp. AS-Z3 TaxID=3031330 RepID=UPI002479EEA1|nr:SOS response-associated peptidase family protein [Rhodanobacter sp. AS-Z3]WEN14283.1 SOS response-associated peptidase family protein [Rhodanobacter sp. AS-Z3]
MCYSAQIKADYHDFLREYGAVLSLKRFSEVFWEKRQDGGWSKIPKAMRDAFRRPRGENEFELAKLVAEADREQADKYEAELSAQTERLVKAEAVLASAKPTKKAAEDQRIAGNKINAAQRSLEELQRKQLVDKDSRIYPGQYAAVMIEQAGQRLVVPMRYQCRLPDWDEATERKYPGTYNARRDNLEKSWGKLFGYRHGILVVTRFYENVSRHKMEGRALTPDEQEENVVLEFNPQPPQEMLVACLWNISKRADHGTDLLSFAAITDEPPPEVAAAGHDRCIIPIKPEYIDRWLSPDSKNLQALYAILDDRARPYYQHRLAA